MPASIAGYRIDRVLGGGAMSTVYLAHHPTLPQWAALKVLHAEFAENPATLARFVNEGNTTAEIGHRNVVVPYGRGVTEDVSCGLRCSTSKHRRRGRAARRCHDPTADIAHRRRGGQGP
jgi:serine/threonine protein kinase